MSKTINLSENNKEKKERLDNEEINKILDTFLNKKPIDDFSV